MSKTKTFKGTTLSGFKFEISEDRLKNFELLEAIKKSETDGTAFVEVVHLLLGPKAKDLKDHVRTEEGLIPSDVLAIEIEDIIKKVQPLKN